jgi:hypothetical protein
MVENIGEALDVPDASRVWEVTEGGKPARAPSKRPRKSRR